MSVLRQLRVRLWASRHGWQFRDATTLTPAMRKHVLDPLEVDYPDREFAAMAAEASTQQTVRTRIQYVMDGRVDGVEVTVVGSVLVTRAQQMRIEQAQTHVLIATHNARNMLGLAHSHGEFTVDNTHGVFSGDAEFDQNWQIMTDDAAFARSVLRAPVIALLRRDPAAPNQVWLEHGLLAAHELSQCRPERAQAVAGFLVQMLAHSRAQGARV